MHSIKKAARRSAWYQDDEYKTFIPNPFGRMSARPRPYRDEENQLNNNLTHTVSENVIQSPAETRRRQSYEDSQQGFQPPLKAETFPAAPTQIPPQQSADLTSSTDIESGSEKRQQEAESVPQHQKTGFVDQSVGSDTGPRKRKLRKFIPWKKEQADSEDVSRTDTTESKKNAPKITIISQLRVVFLSWVNLLLVCVPVGIALANVKGINQVVVFVINFIAIIPLAGMLSFATEELALYVGETLGGLLNASFGNAVELIVGIIALVKKQIIIVKTSLIGSMLSNLLLVMGMCFFFGGLRRTEQFFNVTVAQTAASLLALAIGSLIIPTAFGIFASSNSGIAPVSRGTSVLLLVTYACYLTFQLRTHADMYNAPSQKSPKKPSKRRGSGDAMRGIAAVGAGSGAAAAGGEINRENLLQAEDEDEVEVPQLTRLGAFLTLAGSTVLVALCAEYMVSAISAVATSGVSPEFIGLILLPIVGNAAEHATAVTVAIKDKMDLAIGVAIGSSLQIALLVLPLMVLLNWWGVGKDAGVNPMTLDFDGFLVSVLFIAIILVNYLIQDGKSHWLEGALLQVTYLIIAVSAWFYPASDALLG